MKTAEAPTSIAVAVVATGLVLAVLRDWRPGAVVIAAGVLVAAGFRLVLPVRRAGWLVVRGRALDATVLLVLGGSLLVLALSIPNAR
jgi:hypothetical protein